MAIIYNKAGFEHAKKLIKEGEVEWLDANWNEERPTPDEVNHFINTHYIKEYGLWFLAINDQYPDTTKEYYDYPYGDLKEVQLCALVDSMAKAEKNGHSEVANAAKKLIEMVNKLKNTSPK